MGEPKSSSIRSGLFLAAGGAVVSLFATATYFLVIPRWPDLRDNGVPSVILALVGVILSYAGLRRSFQARRRRAGSTLAFAIGILFAAFLAVYIFYLSYQLPPSDRVVKAEETAPSFQLLDQEGRKRTLEEFRGKPLFLIFFRGHW